MNFIGVKTITDKENPMISRINNHSHSQNHSNKLTNSLGQYPR